MATKVKGETIQESSIPLSALADDVKREFNGKYGLNGYLGTLSYDNKTIHTDLYYKSTVYIRHLNNISELSMGVYELHDLFPNTPPALSGTIGIHNIDNKLVLDLEVNNSYWVLTVYKDLFAVPIQTPDWNALKGEAGYIKNKPFYTEGDIRQIDVNEEYAILIGEFNIGDRIDVSWDLDYYDTDEVFHGSASFVIQEEGEEPTQYYEGDNFYIRGGKSFEMYAYDAGNPLYGKVTVMVNGEIKTLEEKYIPNTVIKTTPQTLADNDKNQALANLGINNIINIDECIDESDNGYDSSIDAGTVSKDTLKNVLGKYFYRDSIKFYGFPILYDTLAEGAYLQVKYMKFDFNNNELDSLIAGTEGDVITSSVTISIAKNADNGYTFKYSVR